MKFVGEIVHARRRFVGPGEDVPRGLLRLHPCLGWLEAPLVKLWQVGRRGCFLLGVTSILLGVGLPSFVDVPVWT